MTHDYDRLTPDVVLDAVDSFGLETNGSLLVLNSYENRVYQAGLQDGSFVVTKFYRPDRWSDAAILEEHAFSMELDELEIPVVPPLENARGETLCAYEGFRFAVYPRRGGRTPEITDFSQLEWIGRLMGRLHRVGAQRPFVARPDLTIDEFGYAAKQFLLEHNFVPDYLRSVYDGLTEELLDMIKAEFEATGGYQSLRLHGDCHIGNILWTDDGPHFVDLDDARNGPAIQDLWMLLSGDRQERQLQLSAVLEGYTEFMEFNPAEIRLIESLRTLRMIHYAGWLAKRWDDPAFPMNFPWFEGSHYWDEHIATLREQREQLLAAPLKWL